MSEKWQVVDVEQFVDKALAEDVSYKEVLRAASMHCGLYRLRKGSTDMQTPHDEDELYYVLAGRAKLRVGGQEQEVRPGTLLYVQASEEHAFFEIEEDMTLLVIFS